MRLAKFLFPLLAIFICANALAIEVVKYRWVEGSGLALAKPGGATARAQISASANPKKILPAKDKVFAIISENNRLIAVGVPQDLLSRTLWAELLANMPECITPRRFIFLERHGFKILPLSCVQAMRMRMEQSSKILPLSDVLSGF